MRNSIAFFKINRRNTRDSLNRSLKNAETMMNSFHATMMHLNNGKNNFLNVYLYFSSFQL